MKRMLLAAATSSICALVAPGLATAAHHSKCHKRAHRACAHVHHAKRARVLTFGSIPSTSTAPGATTPTTPTTPGAPTSAGETAGTVTSFTGGVLVITLTDGSTVSGKVTEGTEIRCESASTTEGTDDDQQGDESSGGNGEDNSSHGGPGMSSRGDDMSSGGSDGEDGEGQPSSCTTAALVAGAVVREAELSVSSAGAVWDHLDLVQ